MDLVGRIFCLRELPSALLARNPLAADRRAVGEVPRRVNDMIASANYSESAAEAGRPMMRAKCFYVSDIDHPIVGGRLPNVSPKPGIFRGPSRAVFLTRPHHQRFLFPALARPDGRPD